MYDFIVSSFCGAVCCVLCAVCCGVYFLGERNDKGVGVPQRYGVVSLPGMEDVLS